GLRSTAYIMNTNPSRQTTGATLMRLTLKMSGSKVVGVDTGPVIRRKPMITTAIPMPSRIKLVLSKANFSLLIYTFTILLFTIYYLEAAITVLSLYALQGVKYNTVCLPSSSDIC